MRDYVLLYGEKKIEDNICITNMFDRNRKINLGWTEFDYKYNVNILEQEKQKGVKTLIFLGLEIGWDKLIIDYKKKNKNIEIKVICNTQDSLLYYEYERENFFKLLELSKKGIISKIAFLRKSQYNLYKSLGYNCCYLMQNYTLHSEEVVNCETKDTTMLQLGFYPLNYTWDKNIFNQLCIPRFLENCNVNYYCLDTRMKEFLDTMNIKNSPKYIEEITEKTIINELKKNDIIVSTAFTEYMHPIFFLSMEIGIPCLIGNTSDFFDENDELKEYIVTDAEDNAIINAKKVELILKNKEKIFILYKDWKKKYNEKSKKVLEDFINN